MVMKRNAMRTNLRQSIFKSLGRYIAIAMIIALGSALFMGLRMTKTDMVATGQEYMDKQNMFDLRLTTSYGWSHSQLEDIREIALEAGAEDAEGIFFQDMIALTAETDEDAVYRFYTMPKTMNRLVLVEGRMPETPNECLADGYKNSTDIIGTKVLISDTNEETTLDSVREKEFTVVGIVSSPLYMDMNRGTTSVGNGSITNYYFVPEEAFDVDYYSEIHVTIPGDYKIYTEEYNDAMAEIADVLETNLWSHAQYRFRRVKREALAEYNDGVREYEDGLREYEEGKLEAEQELADAYQELLDAEKEIQDNEKLLTDGEEQIADAEELLKESEITLQESRKTLADSKVEAYAQITESTTALMETVQDLETEKQEVENELIQVEAELTPLETQISVLETNINQVDSQIEQNRSMIKIVDNNIELVENQIAQEQAKEDPDEAKIAELEGKLAEYEQTKFEYYAQIAELEEQRQEYSKQLEPLYAAREELQMRKDLLEAELDTIEASEQTLESSFTELLAMEMMMEMQFEQAEARIESGEAQIALSKAELEERKEEIAEGWIKLEEGKQELADGWVEYEEAKEEVAQELADAEQELEDARIKLEDAKETIDAMTTTSLYVLDRNSNIGYSSLDSSSDIVAGVSRVLPAFFLLVAALVCITTMTRMVDEERTQIGTLKALGYSNNAIISKYMLYAGSSAVLGCGLGVFAGSAIFPNILWSAYKIMLYIQNDVVLAFDYGLCAIVVFAYAAVELVVTWYCCHKTLEEVPAELIRPKAPEVGKPLVFERFRLWSKVSFLNKVTIRNIFRYRQRFAMMMVGIGGCTALLLAGFGLRDSIVNIVDFQFQEITVYDMSVYFNHGQTAEQQEAFMEDVEPYAQNAMFYHQQSVEINNGESIREIYLISASEEISTFIRFHDGNTPLTFPEQGEMLLSVGVAEAMGIRVGDHVEITDADRKTVELTVSGIYDNHVENYCIITPETYEDAWGIEPELQMAFLQLAEEQDVYQVGTEIIELDDVMNVSVSDDLAGMVRGMMDALDLVVWVVVFCAALLGATVLYNLTNINITERIREIATIKVLGFNARETALYIFKENITLTVMGSAFGLVLGKLLLDFVMTQVKIDMVWFSSRAMPLSYGISILLTILTALVVDFVFYFRLEKINMAEALKSVE